MSEPSGTPAVETAVARIKELNEKIVASAKQTGEESIKTYERMLEDLAQAQETAGARGAEWVQEFARAQAAFTRQLAVAFPSFLEQLGQRGRDLVDTATATARAGVDAAGNVVRGGQQSDKSGPSQ